MVGRNSFDGSWPSIFELCPKLVLRIPEDFRALGLQSVAGMEWIPMNTMGEIEAHIKWACMAVIPAKSGDEAVDKHALFARHGLPCLCAEKIPDGLVPPLRFRDEVDAALIAYRLLQDDAFREKHVKDMRDFALSTYSYGTIFDPINRLLKRDSD